MLRVEIHDSANTLSVKLEGRFTGDDAESTRNLTTRSREGIRLVVDLTGITYIDSVGEEVLAFFGRSGAEFAASTSYTLDVCDRLQLRFAGDGGLPKGPARKNAGRRRAHASQSEIEKT